jgi:hypothetical protein
MVITMYIHYYWGTMEYWQGLERESSSGDFFVQAYLKAVLSCTEQFLIVFLIHFFIRKIYLST